MKRPIDQSGGDKRAVTWKRDDFGESFNSLPTSRDLHRYAGRVHGLSCLPKLSAIDRRYYAEINRWTAGAMEFNVAMGVGDNPLAAAIDGYRRTVADPVWFAYALESEWDMFMRVHRRQASAEARLVRLLAELQDLISRV